MNHDYPRLRNALSGLLLSAALMLPASAFAQAYCVPAGTTLYNSGCGLGDLIDDISMTGSGSTSLSDLSTGCSINGFRDATAQIVSVEAGQTYQMSISTGPAGNDFTQAIVWIDFNNDFTFAASESVGSSTSVGTTSSNISIAIPLTAPVGNHRMRVRLVDPSASPVGTFTASNACTTYDYGETHDYTIQVVTGLPVTFVRLEGRRHMGAHELEWTVASERELSHYVVERSGGGSSFEAIGMLPLSSDMHTGQKQYQFTDYTPLDGLNLYRIAAYDLDGDRHYSQSLLLQSGTLAGSLQVFPNPGKDRFTMHLPSAAAQEASAELRDLSGRLVYVHTYSLQQGNASLSLEPGSLPPGIYQLRLWLSGEARYLHSSLIIQ